MPEDEYSSAIRGFQERFGYGRQARPTFGGEAENEDTGRQANDDVSGLSGPPGARLGLPESTPPGMWPGIYGPPRLDPKFREHSPPQVEQKDAVNGVNIDLMLGFPVRSILCDNFTPQWLYIPSGRRYIAPNTMGAVIPIFAASQKATVVWEAPPGVTQPGPLTNAIALLYFCEIEADTPSPGAPLPLASGTNPAPASPTGNSANSALATGTAQEVIAETYGWNGATWDQIRAIGNALRVSQSGGATLNTGQVAVGVAATLILAANANRYGLTVTNTHATAAMYVGAAGVTVATGQLVPANSTIGGIRSTAALYGIGSAALTATYFEEAV